MGGGVLQRADRRDVPPSRAVAATPGSGASGPTSCRVDADLDRCVELMLAYDDPTRLDQRGAPRPARVLRRRQRVSAARCCGPASSARAPGGRALRVADAMRLVNVAARLLRANLNTAAARRPARRPRRARRLRAQRSAVLPLQRHGAGPACRGVQPPPLLVPRLPDPARPAAARPRHADRPAPRRQAVRRRTHLADRVARRRGAVRPDVALRGVHGGRSPPWVVTRWRWPRGRSSGSPCCSGRAPRGTRRARRRRG